MKKITLVLLMLPFLSGCAGLTGGSTPELSGEEPKPMPNRPQGLTVDQEAKGDSICMPPSDYEEVMDYVVDLETWAKNHGGTR